MKQVKKMLMMFLILSFCLIIFSGSYICFAPVFGTDPKGNSLERMRGTFNYKGKRFVNNEVTNLFTAKNKEGVSFFKYFFPPEDKNPLMPLPSKKFSAKDFKDNDFVWLGHSTVLFKTMGVTVITDPVFSNPSPIPGLVREFTYTHIPLIKDLPKIDIVLISHDHYDHLDHKTIRSLADNVNLFLVPLGVRDHLLHWGVMAEKIKEFAWYEEIIFKDIQFVFTPARHFSGRNFYNRNSTLWGSWVIKNNKQNIYFGGDSGYTKEFKSIGDKYGPFDIAFLECGAYNLSWADIHMMPEETVKAGIDLQGKLIFPIHWAKFDLSRHNWDEPIKRFTREALKQNMKIAHPMVGEVFTRDSGSFVRWWEIANS